jgi:hypothetical protein
MAGTRSTPPPKKAVRVLTLIAVLVIFGAVLILGSRSLVQAECELCVTYRGMTTCRTGSGANAAEAQRAAQKAACAVMTNGMNDVIACDNTPPTNLQCRN